MLRGVLLAMLVALPGLWPAPAAADGERTYGVAVTPANFPDFSPGDVDDAFRLAADVGDHAVFIYQWSELDLDVARIMVSKARRAGLVPIVGLSPTTLDQGRKALDLPADVRRRAGPTLSFANPVIRAAYKQAALGLASLGAPYLCLATEINFLGMQRINEYVHFARLYHETYGLVKRVMPHTRVFVSFQWEWMRILDAQAPHRVAEHRKVVDIFRPNLDAIGLTVYPAPFHETPADLAPNYFTWLRQHVRPADEIMLMEVGWPTGGRGTEAEQRQFVRALPGLLEGVNVSLVAWALLHDVGLEAFDDNLNTVGLITRDGRRKPAFDDFRALHAESSP